MDNQAKLRDVVIVGAGVSGLAAAKFLKEKGVNEFVVLEANDRVGGRTYTIQSEKTKYVDLGGAYIGVTQSHLWRLIHELDIKTYLIDETTNTVVYDSDTKKKTSIPPQGSFTIGSFLENLDVNNFMRKLDEIGDEIDVKEPWNSKNALKYDHMTYQDLIDQECCTTLAKKFAKCFINLNVTCEPYEASVLWFCWYIRQCGGVKRIVSTTGGGQERKTIGGMQQLSIKLAEKIGNDKIKLNDPVLKIKYNAELNKTKCCLVTTSSGKEYYAKKVILALPPINQQKIHFTPALPPMRTQLNQRYPMGTVIKAIIYYERSFWKDHGCCGSVLQLGSDPTKAPLFYTLNDTKPDGSKPALIGFILADRLRALINYTKEERGMMIAKSLYAVFGDEQALKPVHYEEHTMMNEQYIGGCYTAFAPPGFLTNFGPILRKNIENKIFFAGTETSFNWSGYINGAIDAGERASREILVDFGKLKPNEIWVEEPYLDHYPKHEFKDSCYELYAPSAKAFKKFGCHAIGLGLIAGLAYMHFRKGGWCPMECLRKA